MWHTVEPSREADIPYTGALRILKVMLSYDYLWINIRVKGGDLRLYERHWTFRRGIFCLLSRFRK